MCPDGAQQTMPPGQVVMIGALEPMARIGMASVLADTGVRVVEAGGEVGSAAGQVSPDVVVLPLPSDAEQLRLVRSGAPNAKVILWAHDESEMHVYDAGADAPRRIAGSVPAALVDELAKHPGTPREE